MPSSPIIRPQRRQLNVGETENVAEGTELTLITRASITSMGESGFSVYDTSGGGCTSINVLRINNATPCPFWRRRDHRNVYRLKEGCSMNSRLTT